MGTQQQLKLTGRLNSNVEVGKFTALVFSVGTYTEDGVDVPAGSNAAGVAGIADESILPEGFSDYSGGVYQITSGTAWPSGANPSTSVGRGIAYLRRGKGRAIAASAIAVGDHVNIADAYGRLKTIDETAGTVVHEVGVALSAALVAGDVFKLDVNPVDRHS